MIRFEETAPKQAKMVRENLSVYQDLSYGNPILWGLCQKNANLYQLSCRALIKRALAENCSLGTYNILMSILPSILASDYDFLEYRFFFEDFGEEDHNTCFAMKIKGEELPKFSDHEKFILRVHQSELVDGCIY